MNWTMVIVQSVSAIGAVLLGPVLTMIIPPATFVDSYVYGVIDGLLVVSAILLLHFVYTNISKHLEKVG